MRVLGFGLRPHASRNALEQVLARVLDAARALDGDSLALDAMATLTRRVEHQALRCLAQAYALPVIAVDEAKVAGVVTPTRSVRIEALFGTGSIAEATALLVAGDGARIIVSRIVSSDGTASAAMAGTEGFIRA
ncbi:MAG: cobalamin biosynthesis protein [Acetobacter papayae]